MDEMIVSRGELHVCYKENEIQKGVNLDIGGYYDGLPSE